MVERQIIKAQTNKDHVWIKATVGKNTDGGVILDYDGSRDKFSARVMSYSPLDKNTVFIHYWILITSELNGIQYIS